MNRKELVLIAVGVFLTMIALMANEIYHIQRNSALNRDIQPVAVPQATIDEKVFPVLRDRNL